MSWDDEHWDDEHWVDAEPQGDKIDNVAWVYHAGFYDGPISGMVRLPDGREVWAEMIEECGHYEEEADREGCAFFRRYQLWRLTDHQYDVESARHADFRRWVGTHTDYVNGRRDAGAVKPQEQWHRFYDVWGGPPNSDDLKPIRLTDAIPVGWFEQ